MACSRPGTTCQGQPSRLGFIFIREALGCFCSGSLAHTARSFAFSHLSLIQTKNLPYQQAWLTSGLSTTAER